MIRVDRLGDRVVAAPWPEADKGNGTWQQIRTAPEDALVRSSTMKPSRLLSPALSLCRQALQIRVPVELSDTTASQFFINPCTAYGFYDVLQIPKGQYLLQTAAHANVGRMVIQVLFKAVAFVPRVRRGRNDIYVLLPHAAGPAFWH